MRVYFKFMLLAAWAIQVSALYGQTTGTKQGSTGAGESPVFLTEGDSVKNYAGRVISITGPIASIGKFDGKDGVITFLNMFRAYPDNAFSTTIYRQHLPFFEPVEQFKGREVRLTGVVNKYQDKKTGEDRFSIVLKKPEQIEILK
jgi:hypothetical protein